MKRLKLFFACLLMAVLSIGQVWATFSKATSNRTNWYAFYDKCEGGFVVNRITNNWNILLPRL